MYLETLELRGMGSVEMTKPSQPRERSYVRSELLQCPSCNGTNIALTRPNGSVEDISAYLLCRDCNRVGVIVNDDIAWEFGNGKRLTGSRSTSNIEQR